MVFRMAQDCYLSGFVLQWNFFDIQDTKAMLNLIATMEVHERDRIGKNWPVPSLLVAARAAT